MKRIGSDWLSRGLFKKKTISFHSVLFFVYLFLLIFFIKGYKIYKCRATKNAVILYLKIGLKFAGIWTYTACIDEKQFFVRIRNQTNGFLIILFYFGLFYSFDHFYKRLSRFAIRIFLTLYHPMSSTHTIKAY